MLPEERSAAIISTRAGSGFLLGFYCLIGVFMFISCTGSAPQIQQTYWQLNVVNDESSNRIYESLTLFLHLVDEDGVEDIDSVYLIHDKAELFWTLNELSWQSLDLSGETWFGTNRLTMHDYQAFPRGTYRLIVSDKAGEKDRSEIYIGIASIDARNTSFPTGRFQEKKIVINSVYQDHTLWITDNAGDVIKIFTTDSTTVPLSSILTTREMQTASRAFLYHFIGDSGFGLVYGPLELN